MIEPEFSAEERARIAELPAPSSELTAGDILAAHAKSKPARAGVGFALAAAVVLSVGALFAANLGEESDSRLRGVGEVGAVHVQAAAEGPLGTRPLAPGARVTSDERVLFHVETDRDGWLHLLEGPRSMINGLQVSAGSHTPGGVRPQSWRPDDISGALIYVAWVCPEAGAPSAETCGRDQISLVWDAD